MNDPRASTALLHLALDDPPPGGSHWEILEPEPSGRVRLPPLAVEVLDDRSVWARIQGEVLVLGTDGGQGRRVGVDQRGRLYLPVWLRRPAVVAAARLALVADAVVLEPLGDRLLAQVRR